MKVVTDPALIAQLEAAAAAQRPAGGREVTDPDLIATLEAAAAEKAKPPRSAPAEFGRQVGLTARAGIEGLTAIPQLGVDALTSIYDLGAAGVEKLTGIPQTRYSGAVKVKDALTRLGFPQPENATERVVGGVAGAMTGAGGIARLGQGMQAAVSPIARRVGEVLSTNIGTQVLASGTGATAAGVTREEGGGVGAQLAAGALGALVPAAGSGISMAVRGALRGGDAGARRVAQTIDDFEAAGAGTPSVGQATQGRGARAIESALSKAPGGAGRMVATAEAQAAGIGDKVDDMAGALAPRTGAAPAGRDIRAGLGRWVERWKARAGKNYDQLDEHIPADTRIDVTRTQSALADLNAEIPGAPNLSRFFQNAKIKGIEGALKADTLGEANVVSRMSPIERALFAETPAAQRTALVQGMEDGKLPYEALKKLRTLVGNEISNSNLVSDVPRSKWKALYGALTQDMEAAAAAAGPDATKAFQRANAYYSAGMKRIDDVLDPILAKTDPEDVFKAAISGTNEGATTIRGVMKSIPEDSRKVVAATVLRRLGKATPGRQDDMGEVFSTETFLTNWNKLHADSKNALFASMPEGMRKDLDTIARVASNLRDGSKVFANPSGTAQAASNQLTAGAALLALMTGQWQALGYISGGVTTSAIGSRLLTSPQFVKWLAGTTRTPVEQLPAQLNTLSQSIFRMNEAERSDAQEFVRRAREAAGTQ